MPSSPPPVATVETSPEGLTPDRRPCSRSLPLGVLGMVALIFAVEATIMRHDFDLTTLVASNWQLEGKAPTRQHAAKAEILCFGDSMVKFGVQPRVLGGSLGKSVYNFALYCGPPMTSFYQLERVLDAGAKPAAVLVDFQPEILMCDALQVTSRTMPEILGFGELVDLCWTARDSDRLAEFFIARLLPSSRKRFEIRAACTAAIIGQSASIRERVVGAKRNWKANGGAEVLAKNPGYGGEIPDTGAYPSMFWTPWKPNRLSRTYLERFLNLAAKHDIPVFWLIQPNTQQVDRPPRAVRLQRPVRILRPRVPGPLRQSQRDRRPPRQLSPQLLHRPRPPRPERFHRLHARDCRCPPALPRLGSSCPALASLARPPRASRRGRPRRLPPVHPQGPRRGGSGIGQYSSIKYPSRLQVSRAVRWRIFLTLKARRFEIQRPIIDLMSSKPTDPDRRRSGFVPRRSHTGRLAS